MRLPKKRTSGFTRVSSVLGLEGLEHVFEIDENQVKLDFNLSRLPYFVAGQTHADRFRSLVVTERIEKDGKTFESEWRVIHHPELGLPSSFDRDVWIGILQLVNDATENGKKPVPERINLGPAYGFLKRIGKPNNGQYVKMLKDSIERLATTGCITKGAFNCPTSGGYLHLGEVFHLIRSWGLKGEPQTGGGVHETNFVILDPLIRKNLDSFYVSLLRVDYMRGLRGEITKLLYPLLSYRFWQASQQGHSRWSVHWSHLVSYIALKGIDCLKRAKDTLKPALLELKRQQYIDEASDWDGDYYVFFAGTEHVKEHQMKVQAKDSYKPKRFAGPAQKQLTKTATPRATELNVNENPRQSEIGYQMFRLRRGQDLNLERLQKLEIDPQEVYDALEKSKQHDSGTTA